MVKKGGVEARPRAATDRDARADPRPARVDARSFARVRRLAR